MKFWDHVISTVILLVVLIVIGFVTYLAYGKLFEPRTIHGCYVKSGPDFIRVYQEVDWESDTDIKICLSNDTACVEDVMNSSLCKPQ